jgi:heme A synthase
MVFITTEALVGAGLVLFEWVAYDDSVGRAISIVVHLINTFLLLAFLALTSWWATGGKAVRLKGGGVLVWAILIGLVGTLFLGASGALTALGDTLFPVKSLAEGIQQDFSNTAHFLIRLRLLHPTIAAIVGLFLILLAGYIRIRRTDGMTRVLTLALMVLVLVQLAAGVVNVLLLVPVWMQIVHLLLADLVWIVLIFVSASALAIEDEGVEVILFHGRRKSASNNCIFEI